MGLAQWPSYKQESKRAAEGAAAFAFVLVLACVLALATMLSYSRKSLLASKPSNSGGPRGAGKA